MSIEFDAYAICRYVKHYHEKNGYAPTRGMLGAPDEFVGKMVENEIIKIVPIGPGLPPTAVLLTDKGYSMADAPLRRAR